MSCEPDNEDPPSTLREYIHRLKHKDMSMFSAGHLTSNHNSNSNSNSNHKSYTVLLRTPTGIETLPLQTHLHALLSHWHHYRLSIRDGLSVGTESYGRRYYSSHIGAPERDEKKETARVLSLFMERISAGMARRAQLELVFRALEVWKERVESWVSGLEEEVGDGGREAWVASREAYCRIHRFMSAMVRFFCELRSEAIETKIGRYMLEETRSKGRDYWEMERGEGWRLELASRPSAWLFMATEAGMEGYGRDLPKWVWRRRDSRGERILD